MTLKLRSIIITLSMLVTLAAHGAEVTLVPGDKYKQTLLDLVQGPFAPGTRIEVVFRKFSVASESKPLLTALNAIRRHSPGAVVEVILDRQESSNVDAVTMLSRKRIPVWLTSGVRESAAEPGATHVNAVRVGNRILLGSSVFKLAAISQNTEMNALVDSPEMAEAFGKYFRRLKLDNGRSLHLHASDENTFMMDQAASLTKILRALTDAEPGDHIDLVSRYFDFSIDTNTETGRILQALVEARRRGASVRVLLNYCNGTGCNGAINANHLKLSDHLHDQGVISVHLVDHSKVLNANVLSIGGKNPRVFVRSADFSGSDFTRNHSLTLVVPGELAVNQARSFADQLTRVPDSLLESREIAPTGTMTGSIWVFRAANEEDPEKIQQDFTDRFSTAAQSLQGNFSARVSPSGPGLWGLILALGEQPPTAGVDEVFPVHPYALETAAQLLAKNREIGFSMVRASSSWENSKVILSILKSKAELTPLQRKALPALDQAFLLAGKQEKNLADLLAWLNDSVAHDRLEAVTILLADKSVYLFTGLPADSISHRFARESLAMEIDQLGFETAQVIDLPQRMPARKPHTAPSVCDASFKGQ